MRPCILIPRVTFCWCRPHPTAAAGKQLNNRSSNYSSNRSSNRSSSSSVIHRDNTTIEDALEAIDAIYASSAYGLKANVISSMAVLVVSFGLLYT
jgi:hypothetical protein